MGGFGSGSWYRLGPKKLTTENQRRLDIRRLKKQGCLRAGILGSLSWPGNGKPASSIGFQMEADRMILSYRHRPHGGEWNKVEQVVFLDRTPCNYGGRRPWFRCPGCGKRVAVLYYARKDFLCRVCCGFTYTSQQKGKLDRLIRKANIIDGRMGGKGYIFDFVPDKPKYMHWKTYWRLRKELEQTMGLVSWMMGQQLSSINLKLNTISKKLNIQY